MRGDLAQHKSICRRRAAASHSLVAANSCSDNNNSRAGRRASSLARHGTARHGTARHGTARHGTIEPRCAAHSGAAHADCSAAAAPALLSPAGNRKAATLWREPPAHAVVEALAPPCRSPCAVVRQRPRPRPPPCNSSWAATACTALALQPATTDSESKGDQGGRAASGTLRPLAPAQACTRGGGGRRAAKSSLGWPARTATARPANRDAS